MRTFTRQLGHLAMAVGLLTLWFGCASASLVHPMLEEPVGESAEIELSEGWTQRREESPSLTDGTDLVVVPEVERCLGHPKGRDWRRRLGLRFRHERDRHNGFGASLRL